MTRLLHRLSLQRSSLVILVALLAFVGTSVAVVAQHSRREFSVAVFKYGYRVAGAERGEIRVTQDDLVKITLEAEDIPHSFNVDEYRISKRAEPGKPVTFEFRADRPGTFPIYCNLTIDERCRKETRGTLIVTAK